MGSSAADGTKLPTAQDAAEAETSRFTPEEEAALLKESRDIKADANALFTSQDYHNALSRYDDAIATCPKYLHYERAVLQSNIAACHLKLDEWKGAIKVATAALDSLTEFEKQDPELSPAKTEEGSDSREKNETASDTPAPTQTKTNDASEDAEEEIISSGALKSAPAPPSPRPDSVSSLEQKKADVLRIRTKALLRRARARSEAGGWQNLAGAEEDYRTLSGMPGLGPADLRTVRAQLAALPPRTKAAQEAEMAEMWGKLRNLGDGILKPFGLSTNNFQMVKDENTGGYSLNFSQGGGSSSS
ncbi:hypothetical protein JDV02_006546 [Purpureocillium takamizusanense]|uniref:Tetratricopeptide repeat protein 1 n=1 Tax=Purpureocillium takamizusanense TaxID=2060973 RepID=A0A9Q8VC85_9HYPO|nr:uncharacterized protein JDV02_006546 [Purpureocillium takamizusanense]UNI20463.1 hypothetical protein JDV02_006546 [Purpureocillium takamizusanense]